MHFIYMLNIAVFVSLSFLLASCGVDSDRASDHSNSEELSKLKKEFYVFENDILSKMKDLGSKIDTLGGKVDEVDNDRFLDTLDTVKRSDFLKFETETTEDILEIKQRIINPSTVFNLKEKQGFSRINSDGFVFCVSVDDVQPYLEGFKVSFKIGNPMFATFHNPKVHIKWGKGFFKYYKEQKSEGSKVSDIFDSWKGSLKEKEISTLKELKPGVWNKVEFVLTPSTLEEIEYVEFSMEADTISFYRDTSTS